VVSNADGSGATVIGPDGYGNRSPDGRRIAMLRAPSIGATDVYTIKADGTDVARVTRGGQEKVFLDWQPLHAGQLTQTTVSSPPSIIFGQDAAFTSTVTSPGTPATGLLQFRVDGENDGAPKPLGAGGGAAYSPPFLLDVGDVVSATYSGDRALGWSAGDAPLVVLWRDPDSNRGHHDFQA
jgi:Bacterial Ig-like domain (group 3)